MAAGSPPSARGGPPRRKPAGDEERTTVQDDAWEESTTIADDEAIDPVPARPGGTPAALIQTGGTGEHTVDEPHPSPLLPSLPLAPARPVVGSAARATFVVEAGPDSGRRFALDNPRPSTIGRATDNDLVLADIAVSRKHVNLRFDGTTWLLRDRGSGNGTVVNGEVEENEVALRSGDRVEIGNTVLRFEHLGTAMRGDGPDFSPAADDDARTVDGRAFRDGNAELVLPARPPGARPTQPPPMGVPAPAPGVVPVGIATTGPIAVRPTAAMPAMAPMQRATSAAAPGGVSSATLRAGAAAPVPARTAPRTAPPPLRRATAGAPTEPPTNAEAMAAMRPARPAPEPVDLGPPPPLPPLFAGPNVPPPAPVLGTMAPPVAPWSPPAAPSAPVVPSGADFGALPAPRRRSQQAIPHGERGAPTMPIAPHQRLPVPGATPAVRRRWLPWVIAAAALLLVGGAAAAVMVAFSDASPGGGGAFAMPPTGSVVALGAAVDARPVADARPLVADARPVVVDATPAIVPVVVDAAPAIVPVVVDATPARDAATVLTPAEQAARDAAARAEKDAKERERKEREAKAERAAEAALDKAEGQYNGGNASAAASTVRGAMSGVSSKTKRSLAAAASDYDQVSRGLGASKMGSATEGLAAVKKAIAADKRSGGALGGDLKKQLAVVAPKAALANMASGKLEAAFAATQDATSAGAGGNATVRSVLTKLESEAGKLFTSGKGKLKSNRDAGLADLRRIGKIVPKSSAWVAKANKAIADAGG